MKALNIRYFSKPVSRAKDKQRMGRMSVRTLHPQPICYEHDDKMQSQE